jgi:hypothetical protein
MRVGWNTARRLAGVAALWALPAGLRAAEMATVQRYHVLEVSLTGPRLGPSDTPARDVELAVSFRHESGAETIRVLGFWDGDGKGGAAGGVFKVRFCPTLVGRWRIVRTQSNRKELSGQREGDELICAASKHPGFWLPDGRWYRRSDGSHPFLVGNTHYTFLSGRSDKGPSGFDPVADVRGNARFFRKLRFSLGGGRYPDPACKPFLDDKGRESDDGRFSLRPNPAWFHRRVDGVVREGFARDLVCDLILCGPDTQEIRSTLKGDPAPYLRYVAARYASYPNVWLCLCNEWNIKRPSYQAAEIIRAGEIVAASAPNPTPTSVHGNSGNWSTALNGGWHDHVIIQWKLKKLPEAADAAARNHARGGRKPVCNDENAYEGDGDGFSEGDVIEGCLGTFLGGGYPTTGEKYAGKKGQYFWGGFDAASHHAADNLGALRDYVDRHVAFWRMKPTPPGESIFSGAPESSRLLADDGREYVLGTNRRAEGIRAKLPAGTWRVVQLDLMVPKARMLSENASGELTFGAPPSRAVITHFRRADADAAK